MPISENKYLVYLSDKQAKNNDCISGWYIHDIKVKKIEKEIIKEFLTNWRWGNALKNHKWSIKRILCKCPHHSVYLKWFEKKWEEKKCQ